MKPLPFEGRSILVVEDEPLIILAIAEAFEETGASLTTTNSLTHALLLAEKDGLSAAILDHVVGDGDTSLVCKRLKERGIPYVLYTGLPEITGPCAEAPRIAKPAAPGELVSALTQLLEQR
jgi:CheY-like chemotaxis protein